MSHYLSVLSTEKGQNFAVKGNIYFPENHAIYRVNGPCNGLLCLEATDHKVALWNPSTREIRFLPQPTIQLPPPDDGIEFFQIFTGFSWICFGFDSNSEDYKVARFVVHYFEDEEGRRYIYGVYYWIATEEGEIRSNRFHFILSFDFAIEKFSTIPLPFGGSLEHFDLELLDFNGSLGAIVFPKEGDGRSFNLWVMNNGSWTREFSIEPFSGVDRPLG
ncbi:hypothetical protein PTKIN_Ptkin14bG0204700 [Pterospermum kingtungense]